MATAYTLNASACPAPQVPVDPIWLGDDPPTPTTWESAIEGAVGAQDLRSKLNRNAERGDLTGRYGGGAIGITWGLELTAGTGLQGLIGVGQAMIDGPVELRATVANPTTYPIALADNTDNYVWLSQAAAIAKKTAADTNPLLPPNADDIWLYLGMLRTLGGVVTVEDGSGRLSLLQGNQLMRRTADIGKPTDTPPLSLRFWTQTATGLYFWDGAAYWKQQPAGKLAKALADANTTLTSAEASYATLTFTGTLTAGRDVVLPILDGEQRLVKNGTGQTLTFKASGGTGVPVAAGKKAYILGSSTDWERASLDA